MARQRVTGYSRSTEKATNGAAKSMRHSSTAQMMIAPLFLALALPSAPAIAGTEACGPRLIVDFLEASPDRFALRNAGTPGWAVARVAIDLGPAHGGLIFDITESGAGVSAHQPYEAGGGTAALATRTDVTDGDHVMSLAFARFLPGERFEFAIDLDTTLPGHDQTWVSGADIEGGLVRAAFTGPDGATVDRTARFETDSRADTGRNESCLVS